MHPESYIPTFSTDARTTKIALFFLAFFFSFALLAQTPQQEADILINNGYQALSDKDTAGLTAIAEQAFRISQQANYYEGRKKSLLLLARIYKMQNKFSQTLDYYLRVLSEVPEHKDGLFKASVYNETGSLYFDSALYDKALEYFLKAEQTNFEDQEETQQIKLLKNIGYCFEKTKNYEKAFEYYERILPFYQEEASQRQYAGILTTLSDNCKKLNRYKEASEYELKNLAIRKELKDTIGIGVSLNNLGAIYTHLQENKLALNYFLQSYQLKRSANDLNGMAITSINISILYQEEENYDEALNYLFRALEIQEKTQNRRELAHTCNLIAAVFYYKKNYLKAESYSLQAVKYAENRKANDLLETSYRILSHIYKIQGNNEVALEYYQKYSDVKDSISIQQKIQQQEFYKKALEIENKESRIRYLQIDQELKELEYKKLQLEKEKSDKEWELLKRDRDLQEISLRQQQLEKEKAVSLLKLKEQEYQMEVNAKELSILKQKQLLEDNEKQTRIKELNNKAEIDALKLSKHEADLKVQKTWQLVLIGFFFITLVIIALLFNRYKLNQKASQNKLANKNLEIEQKFLRAQMNPHFIFNALNSIQSFVTLNDTYSAERYLARFSRLMRYILDNTSQPYIRIETEIETLRLYLELEQLRFDYKFDFEIEVAPDIDPEIVIIPPMLTQPYVENSIIHGIMHKKTKGNILVRYYREADCIVAAISDDGIGREEALKIKRKSSVTHKSMGMQVTRDRLKLLNETHGLNYNARISDLLNENGDPAGTKVELKILYKELQ